jgi:GntR family transcriptional repressor for pyruvate dehydrogenase complex
MGLALALATVPRSVTGRDPDAGPTPATTSAPSMIDRILAPSPASSRWRFARPVGWSRVLKTSTWNQPPADSQTEDVVQWRRHHSRLFVHRPNPPRLWSSDHSSVENLSTTVVPGKRANLAQREKPQQIADELRTLIVSGELADGESLGREPELVERFGVSRPSLREALRILETERLIRVVRGLHGGVVVQSPDHRMTARTAALILQARNVSLADVFEARSMLEPLAAKAVASSRKRKSAASELRHLIEEERAALEDPEAFGPANARFHERLVALAGNQTLTILTEMLNEIVVRAVTAVSRGGDIVGSLATRRQGIRSQERLVELIENGKESEVETHWRSHMTVVSKVMLGQDAATVIDLFDHES